MDELAFKGYYHESRLSRHAATAASRLAAQLADVAVDAKDPGLERSPSNVTSSFFIRTIPEIYCRSGGGEGRWWSAH